MFAKTLLGPAMACVLAFSSYAAQATDVVTLRLGHAVFETHPNHDTAVRFKEAVERLSDGSVKIDIYPNRQLGGVKELMDGVNFGTVDMTVNSASALASKSPSVDAFQLPGLIDNYQDFATMATSSEARAIMDELDRFGIVALGLYDGGQRHFLSLNKQIQTMDDFKGLKTRVPPVRLLLDTWRAAGVNPTPMAYGEVYSALETGVLDAVEINLTSINSEKYYEIAKQLTLTGHYFWPSFMLINKERFDALDKDQQDAIRRAANEIVEPQVMAVAALDQQLVVSLEKEHGMHIEKPSVALAENLKAVFVPVIEKYAARSPLVVDFVKAARKLQMQSHGK